MGNVTSETIVATHNIFGRDFSVTRLTWSNTDGLSFDVADEATGAPLHDESFDEAPDRNKVLDLINELCEQRRTLGQFTEPMLNDVRGDLDPVLDAIEAWKARIPAEEAGLTIEATPEPKWPLALYLDLSTSHLTRWEMDNIASAPPRVVVHEYGAFVNVQHDDPEEHDAEFVKDGRFPNLHAAYKLARKHNACWINFDGDGQAVAGLPTFEW